MRKRASALLLAVLILFSLVWACSTVPITGRSQLDLVPDSTMLALSFQEYDKFLSSHKLSENKEQVAMVKRVGKRIQKAVEEYFSQHGLTQELKGYDWEFNLVESDEVNAWAMPGGKVVVYTGILPITKDETGLAVVMGHEIGHAIAKHGNERMSQGLLYQMGGIALAVALDTHPSQTNQLFMAAYGLGAQVGILLPYSRLQEEEADHLGLILMAMAGYDPREAVPFWRRMAAEKKGKAPPEFLSTHPSDETRIRKIEELIPEAMKYYRRQE
ncbi:MAG: M48 family metallopeptidase [Deltaproteobacteria bacterium]|nr:M48 family metallopeptidase [Deltaproteobacteria bacterium]MBW2069950.1 M48 family metallopeptidase [Deltaproteobacteria bacterium]